jgi:hypothetical protein
LFVLGVSQKTPGKSGQEIAPDIFEADPKACHKNYVKIGTLQPCGQTCKDGNIYSQVENQKKKRHKAYKYI